MDERAQKIFDEAFATLDRVAHIEVVPRAHRDDGHLTEHSVNMPAPSPPPLPSRTTDAAPGDAPPPPPPPPTLTDSEELRWRKWIDDRIIKVVAGYHQLGSVRPVTSALITEVVKQLADDHAKLRKQLRAEIAKANSTPIQIDILDTEMSKGSPHWLDPVVKYSGTHDAKRRQAQIDRSNQIQAEARNNRKQTRAARIIDMPAFLPSRSSRRA